MSLVAGSEQYPEDCVCCLCITRRRPHLLQRTIESFRRQSHDHRQLLIIAEGSDVETIKVARYAQFDPNIRLHLIEENSQLNLGELRNLAAKIAGTPLVAQWDDDDFSHHDRLRSQIRLLTSSGADACLLAGAVVMCTGRVQKSRYRPWESSLVCKTDCYPEYDSLSRGEDTAAVERLVARGNTILLDRPELYLYIFHGENSWDKWHFDRVGYEGPGPGFHSAREILGEFFSYQMGRSGRLDSARPPSNRYSLRFESERDARREYPANEYEGRGIVIVAGGERYSVCAWVCINHIRRLGCALPVEVWHLGDREMPGDAKALFESIPDVRCVDAFSFRKRHPMKTLRGWECKPYSIIHSRFAEVLFLDADNLPVRDPTFLFETPQFRQTGAIFWPDVQVMEPERPIWNLLSVEFRLEAEFESGQILIDKRRCWDALHLACHLCEFGHEFWWAAAAGGAYGDKDMFRFAWHALGQMFEMPRSGPDPLDGYGVLCQHDFNGRRLFQHRTWGKWQLYDSNRRIDGFWFESECLDHIDSFRSGVARARQEKQSPAAREMARAVSRQRLFRYCRLGFDERFIELLEGGLVGFGAGDCERWWFVTDSKDRFILEVGGKDGVTCRLEMTSELRFEGRWLIHERMPILLYRSASQAGASRGM